MRGRPTDAANNSPGRRSLELLEAAYRLDGSERDWLHGLASTAARIFEAEVAGGIVVHGARDASGRTVVAGFASSCGSGETTNRPMASFAQARRRMPPALQERLFFAAPLAITASQATGLGARVSRHPAWPWDPAVAKDALLLRGPAGPLKRVILGIALRETTALSDRQRRVAERLAVHLGTAFRLREGEHHVSPCRGDLAADHAAEIWRGLQDGRWSVVDYIASEGKAFVMALRNHPRQVARALTDRQRAAVALAAIGQDNKQIAYALALTGSGVAMLLARARERAGLRTRTELVRAFRSGAVVTA
jgi:DNA-binding CsgD family transcriptional regulator